MCERNIECWTSNHSPTGQNERYLHSGAREPWQRKQRTCALMKPSPHTAQPARRSRRPAQSRGGGQDRRLLAGEPLPVHGYDVPPGQSFAARTAAAGAHQGPTARPLGFGCRPGLHVYPLQPVDQQVRSQCHFHLRAWSRCAGGPVSSVPRGTYSEIYPDKSEDVAGMQRFFKQFSFPGGIGSHATPETPGSIHEGGELGYSVSHAYGTVYDNPDLITLVMVGDGESETGPPPRAGTVTSSSIPSRTGPCCRSCTSMATRSITRPSWPASATRS